MESEGRRYLKVRGFYPKVAALLKNPAFSEEQEWRLVSHAGVGVMGAKVEYRVGKSMLIPVREFKLPERGMSLRLLKFSGGSVNDYAICRSS